MESFQERKKQNFLWKSQDYFPYATSLKLSLDGLLHAER